jgi:alpha-beta hydrolase superfamily lysophospholipase
VAYSNGAALALQHVFARIARDEPVGIDRIVLLSPMIEVSGSARFIGLAGWPALFPRYARAAWLDIKPEYNPFKYNSFPVRAARESYRVTAELRATIDTVADQQRLDRVPPILAFQSVLDDTVDARAVMTRVLDRLPANGSEVVLFDSNRTRLIGPMLEPGVGAWAQAALQGPARHYAVTVVGATSLDDASAVARTRAAGATTITSTSLGVKYPADVHSLSHIALPFRADDPLYGHVPSGRRVVQLGAIAVRGERNALLVSQENLGRLTWNPFHAYLTRRIEATLP